MNTSGSGILGPGRCDFPAQLLPRRRAPAALDRIAHVDAAPAHRLYLRGKIIRLQHDVADAAARRDEFRERRILAAGFARRRAMLRLVAYREQLHVIVLVECNSVVRTLARMRAAREHVEARAF
jgi:hypothetical protein